MLTGHIAGNIHPFDAEAIIYDQDFESNPITRRLRPILWTSFLQHFSAGDHVLDLNCGTGTDAIMLAEHGIRVTAIDASPGMIETTNQKIASRHVSDFISTRQLRFEHLDQLAAGCFDGAISNFGGLNCTNDPANVLSKLAQRLKPGNVFVACLMNKYSLWESMSFACRGRFGEATRRMRGDALMAHVGGAQLPVWYYSAGKFCGMLSEWFTPIRIYGLSIISPTPNSHRFATMHPHLTSILSNLDDVIRGYSPFRYLGDHFVIEARRRADGER